jgi:hypothetical protein
MCSFLNLVQGAVGAASGVYQGVIQNATNVATYTVQSAQTDASNLLAQSQADNDNLIRDANNVFVAAQASLTNTQRSIGNQQRATALGTQYNAQQTNMARATEAMVRGDVEQQIAAAGALGAMRADAAARGVGGSSAEIMRSTMKGTQGPMITGQQSRMQQISFDGVMQAAGLRSNLITSQDYGTTVAAMTYQKSIPTTYITPMKIPDLTFTQMALMGAAGGGGFQQFSQKNNSSFSVGGYNGNGSGGVGQTSGYSSNAVINGVNSVGSDWTSSNAGGGNSWGFTLGGDSSGSSGSGSESFNFSLS